MTLREAEVEALEWEADMGGGQLTLLGVAILACIGLTALVTYLYEEIRHDPDRHEDQEP